MIKKGVTSFGWAGLGYRYKFIICNEVLLFYHTQNYTVITEFSEGFWQFVANHQIKYFVNINNTHKYYRAEDDLRDRKTTRQVIKNELRLKKFGNAFEKHLTGDKS